MYQVIDRSGQAFGPADLDMLRDWAAQHRLTPDMTVIDQVAGTQGTAGDMLVGKGVFVDPLPPDPPVQSVTYAFNGSDVSGEPPKFQRRFSAFFVDLIFGLAVYTGLHSLWSIIFSRFNADAALGTLDHLIIPAVAGYFLLRDALFVDQSIGKRLAGIRVVSTLGRPVSPMHSVMRNLAFAPMAFLPIPGLGYLATPLVVLAFGAESLFVLTQGKRFADGIAGTTVVNS